MRSSLKSIGCLSPALLLAAASLTTTSAVAAPCSGPGAPSTTQTKCLTAVHIPGNALRSFDISFVNQDRGEYYLSDRSNAGVDVIDAHGLKFKRTLGGFVGVALTPTGAVDNNHSGPDGVVTHGRWVYAGDGDSTLKVFDLDAPQASALKQTISTGGTTRLDEMALTSSGEHLLAANNAEDPPFATFFAANGDSHSSHVAIITKITIDPAILPTGFGLSMEQPAWDPITQRFYTSIPIIANNPAGCNHGQLAGPITCDGGLLVTNPRTLSNPSAVQGTFNPSTNEGVIALHGCGPNGATVGPFDNLLLGCTPANNPSDAVTLVINGTTKQQTAVAGIVGSDEVWFNSGDRRYYTGSNRQPGGAVLGVIDALRNSLVETIPQSSGSHSVAAEAEKNLIFVPQVAPVAVVGNGGDTTAVGAGICGDNMGCIAVYRHRDDDHDHDHDHDHVAQNGNH
jgi:hypothetical protein